MGTIIKSAAVITDNGFSAIKNATQASIKCLESAGISPDEVGLLINAGVCRDDNIMEPSIASLIQKDLSMGLDLSAENPDQSTLSFDVVNGACGFLNAVNIADSFLKNRTVRYALVVCGDAHPSRTDHAEFPYVAVGAAALLQLGADDKGFQGFGYISNDNHTPSSVSTFGRVLDFGDQGRNKINWEFDDNHLQTFGALNIELINQYLDDHQSPQIDFLLGSDLAPGFSTQVCEQSQLAQQNTRAMELFKLLQGDAHSATSIAAYDQLQNEITDLSGRTALFSAVGSGDASVCALYRF
ncbi:beta-ketoacyl-[acyl-carrier-protein] synthase family protein [Ketobacter alkanivorans]|uniref:Uncharacterized protein n=1 Tax=Ketobacter alkanivorans TaxID=1917421 RepID=A0A2K9LKM3_9GAMM|nr:hypothetical protein [Ketobacter alkanivorans]AUM12800.1 hypothetical protein Kalk_10385 [Ketobacter alkanivorans]